MSALLGLARLALGLLVAMGGHAWPAALSLQLTNGTQAVWPHVAVMAEFKGDLTPQQAQDWFDAHEPLRLRHEQAQVGGWVPHPTWARLVIRNEGHQQRTKVLVFPSTTQDEVRVWRRLDSGWALLGKEGPAHGAAVIDQALQPSWWVNFEPQSSTELLIELRGHNRIRFPIQLMELLDHQGLEKTSAALMAVLLAVPMVMTLLSLAYWTRQWSAQMQLLLAMAIAEWVGMLWVSGLGIWWFPGTDRWLWGSLGQSAYGGLMMLSLVHAALTVRRTLPFWVIASLMLFVVMWALVFTVLAQAWPWLVRFALVWLGSLQALVLLGVSVWAHRRQPGMEHRQLILIWSIYVVSALVYHLHRWLNWSVEVTLWANVMQGASVAMVFAASIWQHAITLRDDQRDELQRLRDRQVWLAMMQHDLWQPITSIRTCVELLMARSTSPNDEVMSSLRHASDSLDDFAHAQKPASAELLQQDPPWVDLQALLEIMVQEYRPLSTRLMVTLRCQAQALWGQVNEHELRRLIRNLLTNALRHTPKAGRILLALRRRQGRAWVQVIDTGQGMPESVWMGHAKDQHAWLASEALWQSDRHEGWGMGLYSANRIAREQAWTIHFNSRIGHGTTVSIDLGPFSASDPAA